MAKEAGKRGRFAQAEVNRTILEVAPAPTSQSQKAAASAAVRAWGRLYDAKEQLRQAQNPPSRRW
jgi:hypothetical protein